VFATAVVSEPGSVLVVPVEPSNPPSRTKFRCAVREVDGTGRLERVVVEDLTTSAGGRLAPRHCSF